MKKYLAIMAILISTVLLVISVSALPLSFVKYSNEEYKVTQETDGTIRVDTIHYANPKIVTISEPMSILSANASCYTLFAPGTQWLPTPISYVINPKNSQNLSASFIKSNLFAAAETWDNKTSREILNNTYKINYNKKVGVYDGANAIGFYNLASDVLAYNSIWFSSDGRKMLEFDQLYNTYFPLGNAKNNSQVYDFRSIATHEFGHSIGLDHVFGDSCVNETMYPYVYIGNTKKRTLSAGDIAGLRFRYGI